MNLCEILVLAIIDISLLSSINIQTIAQEISRVVGILLTSNNPESDYRYEWAFVGCSWIELFVKGRGAHIIDSCNKALISCIPKLIFTIFPCIFFT